VPRNRGKQKTENVDITRETSPDPRDFSFRRAPLESPLSALNQRQRRAVCCSVLQCVAVCCSVLQCFAVLYSVVQCVAV